MRKQISFQEIPNAELRNLTGFGIRISAELYEIEGSIKSIRLMGICQNSSDRYDNKKNILERVNIIMTFGEDHLPICFKAINDTILFENDVKQVGRMAQAFFDLDLFLQGGLDPVPGLYFISAVMDEYLSNVEKVTL